MFYLNSAIVEDAGDTGYSPILREMGRKLGPFDVPAIPIGAYEPRWFMRHHHVSPEEALRIHLDVASKKSVAHSLGHVRSYR